MTEYTSLTVTEKDFQRPDFERWLSRYAADVQQINAELLKESTYSRNVAIDQLIDVYGSKSRQVRYLRQERVPAPPNIERQRKKAMREYHAWCDEQARARRREENRKKREAKRLAAIEAHMAERARKLPMERAYRYRRQAATDELSMAGFAEGDDYPFGHAISFANQLNNIAKFEEEQAGMPS